MTTMSEAQNSSSASPTKSLDMQPLPGLQKTFSLGQATQQKQQPSASSTSNSGVLGLSQVTNSMALSGLQEPTQGLFDPMAKQVNNGEDKMNNGLFGGAGSSQLQPFGGAGGGFGFPHSGGENNNLKFGGLSGGP